MKARTNNLVVVADLHCGCELGLCPLQGVKRTAGGRYMPSRFQLWLWRLWREFWDEFVPLATEGESYDVCYNGDLIDGRHHGTTTHITSNVAEQAEIAARCIKGGPDKKMLGRQYMTAGTEAHTGVNDEWVVALGKRLGVVPDRIGRIIRPELWLHLGTAGHHKSLVHVAHHIGSAGVTAYETTAVHRELVEALASAGQWRNQPPDVVVRSHRHTPAETRLMTANGYATSIVTAGWQGKTPYVFRLMSGRVKPPQFGGVVVRSGSHDTYTRSCVWSLKRDRPE